MNVVVGYVVAVLTQIAIFPMFGLVLSVADNLVIGGIFTAVSLLRSFALRRLFEGVRARAEAVSWASDPRSRPGRHANERQLRRGSVA
jgi:hypothetical protein